jgi:hypothetical protein
MKKYMLHFNSAQQQIPNTEKYIFMLSGATSSKANFSLQLLPCRYYNISIGKFTLILCQYRLTMQECFAVVVLFLPNNNLSLTNEFSR